MNNVSLIGNLCRDGEVRYASGENATAIYNNTIAVQRRFKDKQTGNYESDFIRIQAFGNTAEFLDKYFNKGSKVAIVGHIQTGSYTNKDGAKVYTTDVIVDNAEFCTSKSEGQSDATPAPTQNVDDFINKGLEDDLPF